MRKWMGAALLAVWCVAGVAQDGGYWRAMSTTAKSITGDVALGGEKMVINFVTFTVSQIRALKPEEVKALFDPQGAMGNGNLYKLNIPGATKFLRKNTLCGGEDAEWMATYVQGRELKLAFFSGQKAPVFTFEEISSSTNLCGTFTYER